MYWRQSGPIQIDRLLEPFLRTAAGLARFPDAAGKHHDRVRAARRLRDLQRRGHLPQQVGLEHQHVYSAASASTVSRIRGRVCR